MNGKQLRELREKAGFNQAKVAEILQVSARAVSKWESDEKKEIPVPYTIAFRVSFENMLLVPVLREIENIIFEEIKAEFIGIWLVRYSVFPIQRYSQDEQVAQVTYDREIILHDNSARYHCVGGNTGKSCKWLPSDKVACHQGCCYHNDRIVKSLKEKSLITYPLRSKDTLNLAGVDITRHEFKRTKDRYNHFCNDNIVHSLLYIPWVVTGDEHPVPIFLLSIRNKLERTKYGTLKVKQYQLSEAEKEYEKDYNIEKIENEPPVTPAFSQDDINAVNKILKREYNGKLKEIIKAFNYIPTLSNLDN